MAITKKMVAVMLVLTLTLTVASAFNVNGKEVTFKDFQDSHWAYQNVKVLVEAGAIGGYPDGSFKPSGTITNAEFIKIATVQAGFDGQAGKVYEWYKPYVDFAYDKGIIEKGIFSDNAWNKPITRDKMCYVIARVGEYLGEDFSYSSDVLNGMNSAVVDVAGMSEPYKTCVYKALSKGIVTGYANNKSFEPSWNATRAEAAAMLSRLSDKSLRAITHFVSSVVKVDKDFIAKMDKTWNKTGVTPSSAQNGIGVFTKGAKAFLQSYIDKGIPVYYDTENECKLAVGLREEQYKGAYAIYADGNFFKKRGTFPKYIGGVDCNVNDIIYYKDGTVDATYASGSLGAHYGQSIDNVAMVILEVTYVEKQEIWVIENPIIDKEGKVYDKNRYGLYWWH